MKIMCRIIDNVNLLPLNIFHQQALEVKVVQWKQS